MAKAGKLEGRITVPTGGWEAALVGTSSDTATIPAATYYLSSVGSGSNDFLAEVATQFSTATGDTVTCTASLGESGTGIVTLSSTGGTFEVTWTDTDMRDLLGYTGNLTGATSYNSTNHARNVWLPGSANPKITPFGDQDDGHRITDARQLIAPGGTVSTLYGQSRTELPVAWPACARAKTRISGESTTNSSFEKFWSDVILGEANWSSPGDNMRLYWDADVDGTSTTYVATGDITRDFRPTQLQDGWIGMWRIEMLMVKVPS